MREIREEANEGSELHQLAIDLFCYRVKKYIGSYMAVLNGADAVVFTAGIGENDAEMRRQVLEGMDFLGIEIDLEKNAKHETIISKGPTTVMVIKTNEELAIAHETKKVLQQKWSDTKKERERRELLAKLANISGPDRTKIILLWSQDQNVSREQLFKKVKSAVTIDITEEIFGALLIEMGITCT